MSVAAAPSPVGVLLREWRQLRRRSQLDLALEAGVSPRHLSFVETGRSKPSPELLDLLARHLDVPLRERNTLLLRAGYAPRYPATALDAQGMRRALDVVQRLLDAHDPYPGVAVDRTWNLLLANRAAAALVADLPAAVTEPSPNVFRVCLHPEGLVRATTNIESWGAYLLSQVRRLRAVDDPVADALIDEVSHYPAVVALGDRRRAEPPAADAIVVPWELDVSRHHLSLMTTITTFGTPRDVTLDDLAIELFYPLDDRTERALRELADER